MLSWNALYGDWELDKRNSDSFKHHLEHAELVWAFTCLKGKIYTQSRDFQNFRAVYQGTEYNEVLSSEPLFLDQTQYEATTEDKSHEAWRTRSFYTCGNNFFSVLKFSLMMELMSTTWSKESETAWYLSWLWRHLLYNEFIWVIWLMRKGWKS